VFELLRYWRRPRYTGPERRKRPRWRPRPFRVLFVLLLLSAVGYTMVVTWLLAQETRLVFTAGSTLAAGRPSFPFQHVDLAGADGAGQFAWVIPADDPQARLWAVYLHGSATSVASHVNITHYDVLRQAGLNVIAPEYRGFGGIPGTPDERTLHADALAAYHFLRDSRRVPPENILLYGWSLGGVVAVDLAAHLPPAGLMLEGVPASLVDLTSRRYPLFPHRLLMRSAFDPIRTIGRVAAPVLFLHARDDEVIPLTEGRRLYDAAPGARMFAEVAGGHLSAIEQSAPEFRRALATFLRTLGPGELPRRAGM
jgi:hypothetical protein